MEKGAFGYINYKKKRQLIIASLSMLMVAVICLTGILLYHTQKSIYAVMAALAALPAAKMLVGYLVLLPYKSADETIRQELLECCGDETSCRILYDVVLSSTEKSMTPGVLFIKNGKIYGYTEHYRNAGKKEKSSKQLTVGDVEKHIKFIVDANCNYSAIRVFEDRKKYLAAVERERDSEKSMTEEELAKMKEMNERIEDRLKIYMF